MNYYILLPLHRSQYLLLAFIAYHYISRSVRNGAATRRSLLLCALCVKFLVQ